MDKSSPVLVSGGTGYVASWIIHDLLKAGYHVRTSVRDKSNITKYQHLLNIEAETEGTLEVFEADLLQRNAFIKPVDGCEVVFHTASPFKVGSVKNAYRDLVEPALKGTENVLNAALQEASVRRVVLTSSVVSVFGDAIEINDTPQHKFTEENWNRTNTESYQPYNYSKTIAEKKAWEIAKLQEQWQLVVINPGFVMGPSLTARKDSTSIDFMINLTGGKFKTGVPDFYYGVVDVRDVAQAHIKAAFNPETSGRHLLVNETISILDFAAIIRSEFPELPLPKRLVPKHLFYLLGPLMGFSWKYIKNNWGIKYAFDNSYSKSDLGIKYRKIKDTLTDHVDQLKRDHLI